MRLKAFWNDETGAVAVIVAISMVVLIGFTSLVVDYGYWASAKRQLQNTADAAVLAAAAQLDGTQSALSSAQTAAETYAGENGLDVSSDPNASIEVAFASADYRQIRVTLDRVVDTTFSQVLTGKATQKIQAEAVASASSIFGEYDYALFGGDKIEDTDAIDITGNKNTIIGNIHSNSDISIQMNQTTITGIVTAVGSAGSIPGAITGALVRDMPSLSSLINSAATVTVNSSEMESICGSSTSPYSIDSSQFATLVAYAELKAETAGQNPETDGIGIIVYIDGDVNLHASDCFDFPVSMIASGDMTFNGSDVVTSSPITLACGGNMTYNGGSVTFYGTLFAPNGKVTMNGTGGSVSITGSVLADIIDRNGNNLNVTYDPDAGNHLPLTKVRLIA